MNVDVYATNNISNKKDMEIQREKEVILNIEPPKGSFVFEGYKYLPYNNSRQYSNRQTYSYICNTFKNDYNIRKGLPKLCYAKYVYNIKKGNWIFKEPHSFDCLKLNENNNKKMKFSIIIQ